MEEPPARAAKAARKLFIPRKTGPNLVEEVMVSFDWTMGKGKEARQESLDSFHGRIMELGIVDSPLEVSTKSRQEEGFLLSPFIMTNRRRPRPVSVESLYQSCKVLVGDTDSPYRHLPHGSALEAKQFSGFEGKRVEGYLFNDGTFWEPGTGFYDWLYINMLVRRNGHLTEGLLRHDSFTDIEHNPKRGPSTQAHACALFAALILRGEEVSVETIGSRDAFMAMAKKHRLYGIGNGLFD